MKIVVLDSYTLNPGDLSLDALKAQGEVTLYDRTEPADVIERIADAEIVLTNKTPLNGQAIAASPQLKLISVLATGYNIIDVAAAKQHGVAVCNVPAYSADSVAEFVFAFLLQLNHHIVEHDRSVKAGEWQRCPDFSYWKFPLKELYAKAIGIIGYGKIGQRVAEIAQAFGMKVYVYHHRTAPSTVDGVNFVQLDTLYKKSDIISLHVPLFPETAHMIDAEAIAKMKDGVVLVNTARGGLVDEQALSEALKSGKIGHLATDVVSREPIEAANPLLTAPNTTITPHIAWATHEARTRLLAVTIDNIKAYKNGKLINTV